MDESGSRDHLKTYKYPESPVNNWGYFLLDHSC
jgi:hypothetical protein